MKIITNTINLEAIIQEYQLQQIFPPDCLEKLQVIVYEKKDYICRQGDELEQISYFLTGKLKIVHSLANGTDMILHIQEEEGLLGEVELMLGKSCVSSVIADEDSLVVQLPTPLFKKRLLESSLFLHHMGKTLAKKLHYNNRIAPTHIHYSLQERLASHILNQIKYSPIFTPKLSQLADSFGVSYRHLQRVLKQMVDDGWLEKDKKSYHIRNLKELTKVAIKESPFE
ncbi:putative N-ribosylNicotinamide CRP-like regulator [Streptococcus sp. DD10]|uniref:cyclic nucleotide-binding domain-containing protein n=1 Tax=Streptococcus sp. DD10 TaxID=1777878 RepID=UPI00079174F5|nr:cyclic nucleotide-binding domain-containing protein [Streptococcus sp. DD10]KXT72348.1 putative N-ribosylNicotinamide CRP-like regulator [Streptococcus sp. DD10]